MQAETKRAVSSGWLGQGASAEALNRLDVERLIVWPHEPLDDVVGSNNSRQRLEQWDLDADQRLRYGRKSLALEKRIVASCPTLFIASIGLWK